MTPLPKRRLSTRRQGRRRATHEVKFSQLAKCQNCGKPTLTHKACPHCGFYKGKQVRKVNQKKVT